jgi:WD40 repeat protein
VDDIVRLRISLHHSIVGMNSLAIPPFTHSSDQPVEAFYTGLDTLLQETLRLRSETEDLERLKALATLHWQQNEVDLEKLRHIQKELKTRLDSLGRVPAVPNPVPMPPPPNQSFVRTDTKWDFIPHTPTFRRSTVRLRYSLSMSSILCTIRFNGIGSLFAFTDGTNVFFINQSDGSVVGQCEMPFRDGQQGELLSRAICFSPDSKYLVVAGSQNSTVVIDVPSRKVIKTLAVHKNLISTIAFFCDGRKFLTGGFDGKLCVWSVPEFTLVKAIQHGIEGNTGKEEMIAAVAIAPDDEYIAVGFMNGAVGLYEPTFSQPMSSFQAHAECLLNVVISKTNLIATSSHDRTTKLWVIRGLPTCRIVLTGHLDCVLTVAFSPKDPIMFTGSKDETIKCWSSSSGENLFTLTGHRNTLFQIDHHPTERTIVSCSGEGLVCIWDYNLS